MKRSSYKARDPKDYRIILNQDTAYPLMDCYGSLTKNDLIALSIENFKHTPVDVYSLDANVAGGVFYDSKSHGQQLAWIRRFWSGAALQVRNMMEKLTAEGTDPLQIFCEASHQAGIDCMIHVRMNDLHDSIGVQLGVDKPSCKPGRGGEQCYAPSEWRRAHPEYLMGDPVDDTGKLSYEYWARNAPNYALGQVREYMLDMIEELLERVDLDSMELDFLRWPLLFHRCERYAQRHVMTALVEQVHRSCIEVGKRRGRPIRLSVRVPDTVELSLENGLDLRRWLKEGFLDMVTISGGYHPYGTSWADIVSLCKEHDIPAFACLNHGKVPNDVLYIRSAAMRAYDQGVTGIKLWNYFYCMDHYYRPGENPLNFDFITDIADVRRLGRLEKIYSAGRRTLGPDNSVFYAYDHANWQSQLPLTVGKVCRGRGNMIIIEIADDMALKRSGNARLTLEMAQLGPACEIRFFFNGREIHSDPGVWKGYLAHDRQNFEFDIPCSAVNRGENTVELRLLKRDERLNPFVELLDATLLIPRVE